MEVIFGIFGWIVLSYVICAVANSKGRSGCAWLLISLLLSPIIAIIILLCVGDSDEKKEESLRKAVNIIERERARENNKHDGMTQDKAIEELQKAKKMLELEVISQEEYDAKKNTLMPYLRDDCVAPKEEEPEGDEELNSNIKIVPQNQTIINAEQKSSEHKWYNKTWSLVLVMCMATAVLLGGVIGIIRYNDDNTNKKKELIHLTQPTAKPLPSAPSRKKKKSNEDIVIIGRWSLKSVYNSAIEIVEIYKKDGKYYSKERGGKIILLNKIGDRYYYTGTDYANDSYYKIVNGNLRICDDELGDYTKDSGYIITKLK